MDFSSIISARLGISQRQTAATIQLLQDKATIPFIARYRKEKTGSLDEVQIARIQDLYTDLTELSDRKRSILNTIAEQGKLTDALRERIEGTWDGTELEDIYLPYKPHRKTRADVAREKGLQPIADDILTQRQGSIHATEEQLQGARDIIAETIAQDEQSRNAVRREFTYTAVLTTKPVKEKMNEDEAQKYRDYFDLHEPLKRIPSHRLLAIRRAQNEGFIRVDISPDSEKCLDKLARLFLRASNQRSYQVEMAMEDGYKRLLKPSIENEFAALSKQQADKTAIQVFADNLRQLLLDAPLGQKRVLALDPGFRTGCKMVILSRQGDLLAHDVIYIRMSDSADKLRKYVQQYEIEAIAIGNGTASRECEEFVQLSLDDEHRPPIFVVSENGASV